MKTIPGLCAALAIALAAATPAHSHWPGQPPHQMAQLGDLALESGEVIKDFRMSYVTHGTLNAAKDNAILFHHGFAAHHHSFDHMIGPGRPLDTDKYFIICPDLLGATQTGYERTTSATNSGLKMKFPFFNQRDRVNASYRLVTEILGIPRLLAVTGISSGGEDSLQFAVSYPQFMDGIIPVVGGALWSAGVLPKPAGSVDHRDVHRLGRRQLRRESEAMRDQRALAVGALLLYTGMVGQVRRYTRGLHPVAQHRSERTTSTCRTRETSTTG